MKTNFSFNFLIGFLCFFIYLVLVLIIGFKSENISIYDRKKFNRNRVTQQLIWIAPFLLGFLYFIFTQTATLDEFMVLVLLPILFVIGDQYFFFNPKLDVFISDANRLYGSLKYEVNNPQYSFNSKTDKLLFNRDKPEYIRGYLVDLHIDRVCKNDFGEYFWVEASAKGASEPTIKHLGPQQARNLLRVDKELYLQEFNEEPHYKSKQ